MPLFCALEGGDGAGKSYLARAIEQHLASMGNQEVVVAIKDQLYDDSSPTSNRLLGMHRLTWSYDKTEPVWEYSREYWLYSILAWYTFFYEMRVLPAIKSGVTVLTDGWYFKHQARFRLSGIPELVKLADQLFGSLPQPDMVIWLDTPADVVTARKLGTSKPSEHGAFKTGSSSLRPQDLVAYQTDTKRELLTVLDCHSALVRKTGYPITPDEVLGLIEQAGKELKR